MSMCRVFSCVVGRGCLLWPVSSFGKTLLAFALLHSVLQGQICLLLQVFLDFLLLHSWNVKSMNQGKLEVVKQEMARVNINILGINELKWTRMGECNTDDHYIYYCGQESLRRNGVAITVNKSPKCSTWMQSQKLQNDLCSFPRQTIQYHCNPNLCPDQ